MNLRSASWCSLLLIVLCFSACETVNPNWAAEDDSADRLHRSMKRVTDVIVHDIFSPPVASRIYALASIAGYEALRPAYPEYRSLSGQLTDLPDFPQPEAGVEYSFPVASTHAFLKVGRALIFSEDQIDEFETALHEEYATIQMPGAVFERSVAYGEAVADHVLAWADKDNYKQSRTFPKYSITNEAGTWKPTPPDYMDGIEPHWSKMRPYVIDASSQFKPVPPPAFNMTDTTSQFYRDVMTVYNAMNEDTEERMAIAEFWDCNPYVSHHKGHVMFATKKITPGGHWIGIAEIAARQADADMMQAAETYVWTSVALADGFISCWDEKYRSKLIRPETVINEYIDEDWVPKLQTPPFPEYTSGHSVVSRAAAVALTHLYGDDFAFLDTSEREYGLPDRQFTSFLQASDEAAMSRLYGGIHYPPACVQGVTQGEKVGDFIVDNLVTKGRGISQK